MSTEGYSPPAVKRAKLDLAKTVSPATKLASNALFVASQNAAVNESSVSLPSVRDDDSMQSQLESMLSPGSLHSELSEEMQQIEENDALSIARTRSDHEIARRSLPLLFPAPQSNRIPRLNPLHHIASMYAMRHHNRPDPNYMSRQSSLSWHMRSIVVDWMLEICVDYRVSIECRALSVRLFDRVLSIKQVSVLCCDRLCLCLAYRSLQ